MCKKPFWYIHLPCNCLLCIMKAICFVNKRKEYSSLYIAYCFHEQKHHIVIFWNVLYKLLRMGNIKISLFMSVIHFVEFLGVFVNIKSSNLWNTIMNYYEWLTLKFPYFWESYTFWNFLEFLLTSNYQTFVKKQVSEIFISRAIACFNWSEQSC